MPVGFCSLFWWCIAAVMWGDLELFLLLETDVSDNVSDWQWIMAMTRICVISFQFIFSSIYLARRLLHWRRPSPIPSSASSIATISFLSQKIHFRSIVDGFNQLDCWKGRIRGRRAKKKKNRKNKKKIKNLCKKESIVKWESNERIHLTSADKEPINSF